VTDDVVLAAGGVVVRGTPEQREVLVVHRPRYDDWSLPKGKLASGESAEHAAAREVAEETGLTCELGPQLPAVGYHDATGRPKRVDYWVMKPRTAGAFETNDEVDEIRWLVPNDARLILTYAHDVGTLDAALAFDEPIYVVRHGKAGSRADWRRKDHLRPLSGKGTRQAERLLSQLGVHSARHVISSPSRRCVQTIRPLADALVLPVERDPLFEEGADVQRALAYLVTLPGPSIICTHGDVAFGLLSAMSEVPHEGPHGWKKGATRVIERDAGEPVRLRYIPPPRDRVAEETSP